MTTLDQPNRTRKDTGRDFLGIVVVALPLSDLVRSAAWYRDLLDLQYVREFGDQHDVSGCALADFASHCMIALRRRDATAEHADLRGEHPIIVESVDEAAANRIRTRAAALRVASTSASTPTVRGSSSSILAASPSESSTTPTDHSTSLECCRPMLDSPSTRPLGCNYPHPTKRAATRRHREATSVLTPALR